MAGFKDRLAAMDDAWKTSREETMGAFNEAFEDGVYPFQLQSLSLRESAGNGELLALAEHYCLEGDPAGEVYTQWFNLEKENDEGKRWGQVFLAQLVENLGYETPEDFSEIEETLAEIADAAPKYTARIKTKDGYKNISIIRVDEERAEFAGERPEAEGAEVSETEPEAEAGTEAEAEAEAEPTAAENGTAELLEFCEAWDLQPEGNDRDSILACLGEFDWQEYGETPVTGEEAAVLRRAGIPVKAAPKPAAKPKPAPKAAVKPATKAAPKVALRVAAKPAVKPKGNPKPVRTARGR